MVSSTLPLIIYSPLGPSTNRPLVGELLQKAESGGSSRSPVIPSSSEIEGDTTRDDIFLRGMVAERVPLHGPVVSISNADLAWDSEILLKGVNLTIPRGRHIAITGAVGSGKSLLLNAILGEVHPITGNIQVQGIRVAYCSQTVWLENLTPYENVFRWATADDTWYRRVVDACALTEFMDSRISSGETIGTSGAKVSGGEKQRLVRTSLSFQNSTTY